MDKLNEALELVVCYKKYCHDVEFICEREEHCYLIKILFKINEIKSNRYCFAFTTKSDEESLKTLPIRIEFELLRFIEERIQEYKNKLNNISANIYFDLEKITNYKGGVR